jgi:transcription antitermination factor NusG
LLREALDDNPSNESQSPAVRAQWFAAWTRSHCEQLVHDQLIGKGFHAFLPTIKTWSRRGSVRHLIPLAMFPGYVFLRHFMDKNSYVEVLKTRGIVRILGERWDRLAPVSETEMDAIERIVRAEIPALPHPYLREGQRVRITDGPLAGVEGILAHSRPNKGLLIVSVDLLQRSVAVEMDCTRVVPVASVGSCAAGPASRSAASFLRHA